MVFGFIERYVRARKTYDSRRIQSWPRKVCHVGRRSREQFQSRLVDKRKSAVCSKQWPRNRPTSRNLWQLGHLIRLVSRWLSLRTCHSRDNYRFAYEIPRNFTILARWIILDELKFTRYYDDFSNRTSQKFQLQFLRNISSCLRLFTIKLSNWDSYI